MSSSTFYSVVNQDLLLSRFSTVNLLRLLFANVSSTIFPRSALPSLQHKSNSVIEAFLLLAMIEHTVFKSACLGDSCINHSYLICSFSKFIVFSIILCSK